MSDVQQHICIGGPLDRRLIARGKGEDRFAVTTSASVAPTWYVRREIAGERETFYVWLYEKLSSDKGFRMLLDSYVREGR